MDLSVKSVTMSQDMLRYRWLSARLPKSTKRRLVVLTGARQTGKTTLLRQLYPNLRYINLDAVENRALLRDVPSGGWAATLGPAIVDEAQKEPSIFEKVKFAYDDRSIDFTALSGSSRFLLLEQMRESLAGRAFLYDMWPLMASEILSSADETPSPPLLDRLLVSGQISEVLAAEPMQRVADDDGPRRVALTHLSQWGGMPELIHLESEDERRQWLRSYQATFLERDLQDLALLSDLVPFRALQQLVMLRTGQLLSYAELARDAQFSASTAKRYLEYLRLTYQVVLLPPYRRNLTSTVVKTPKVYWIDLGTLRQVTRQFGPLDGAMFESLVVAEIHKWNSTMARDAALYFYRTRSGLEVDLLIDLGQAVLGIEIKNRVSVESKDTRHLRTLATKLEREWLGGLVVYRGDRVLQLEASENIWAVPAHRLLT